MLQLLRPTCKKPAHHVQTKPRAASKTQSSQNSTSKIIQKKKKKGRLPLPQLIDLRVPPTCFENRSICPLPTGSSCHLSSGGSDRGIRVQRTLFLQTQAAVTAPEVRTPPSVWHSSDPVRVPSTLMLSAHLLSQGLGRRKLRGAEASNCSQPYDLQVTGVALIR